MQWHIFECAGSILHEADLGIKAYAVEVFITQGAASCVLSIGACSGSHLEYPDTVFSNRTVLCC